MAARRGHERTWLCLQRANHCVPGRGSDRVAAMVHQQEPVAGRGDHVFVLMPGAKAWASGTCGGLMSTCYTI